MERRRPPRRPTLLRRLFTDYGQEIIVLAAIVVLFIVVTAVNPRFILTNNLVSIFAGNAYIAVAAIGMSMVIITGNIDVSVGALIGVLATIAGTLAVSGYPIWVSWLVPVVVGMAINAIIGILVAYARIPSIVVTLGALVDPAWRPDHRDRRNLDFESPSGFPDCAAKSPRRAGAADGDGRPDHSGGDLDALFAIRPVALRGRRQPGSSACNGHSCGAADRAGIRSFMASSPGWRRSSLPPSCRSSSPPSRQTLN